MTVAERMDQLVQLDEGRLNIELYTSEEVFEEELKNLWYKTWIYLGHESEIKHAGDYKTTYIGLVPIIVSRDEDGGVNAMINRCIHRGTTVCQQEHGNSQFFKCEYHGWVYGNNGALLGTTMRNGYDPRELARFEKGLQQVPRVDTYRGLIFGSLAEEGETLVEHLGNSAYFIDCWADQSPTGLVDLTKGVWTHRYRGNWKLQVEGSDEGYHPGHLHRIANEHRQHLMAARNTDKPISGAPRGRSAAQPGIGADLLHGHSILNGGGQGILAKEQTEFTPRLDYPESYVNMIREKIGDDNTRLADVLGGWRMMVFPNIAFSQANVRVMRPIRYDLTEIKQYYVSLPEVDDAINNKRMLAEQDFYGPAGYGSPDDIECFERMQEGYKVASWEGAYPWAWFNRQLHRQWEGPRGERVNEYSGEAETYALYHEYVKWMGAKVKSGKRG